MPSRLRRDVELTKPFPNTQRRLSDVLLALSLCVLKMVLHLLCVNVNTKNVLKGMFCV